MSWKGTSWGDHVFWKLWGKLESLLGEGRRKGEVIRESERENQERDWRRGRIKRVREAWFGGYDVREWINHSAVWRLFSNPIPPSLLPLNYILPLPLKSLSYHFRTRTHEYTSHSHTLSLTNTEPAPSLDTIAPL